MSARDAYRWDELTRAWVVVTPSRKATASPLRRKVGLTLPEIDGRCPFCPGHEADTETPIAVVPEQGPWRVRVVPNKYPITQSSPDAKVVSRGTVPFQTAETVGEHEVVIETPDHDADLGDLDDAHLAEALRVYRDRCGALARRPGVASVLAFRNRGRRAGSSQPHPHGQVVSSQVLGPHERGRDEAARAFFDDAGELLLGSLLARELDAGERIVEETTGFVALCPFAPHQSRQTWIVPRDPRGSFAAADDALFPELAALLGRTLRRIRAVTAGTDYNLVFRMPPVSAGASPHAFWYVDILPRSSGGAGYELGTGIDLVVIPPEEAAAAMRGVGG